MHSAQEGSGISTKTTKRVIADYNQNMGGVDLTDQYLSYYSLTTRRTLKWWKKVLWCLIDVSVLNSWIIF